MRKRIALWWLVGILPLSLWGQMWNGQDTLYGHEWIEAEQSYLRIPVAEDGWVRIAAASLQEQNLPLPAIDAGHWQLFHQGELVPLYVSTDAPLQSGDYLSFYGRKNRGEFDTYLYRDPANQQLNPAYSLVNDTAVYYLSWQAAGEHLFFEDIPNDLSDPPPPTPYIWQESERVFKDQFVKEYDRFNGAYLYFSHYSIGEGFGSRSNNQLLAAGGQNQTVNLATPNVYPEGPDARLSARYTAALGIHNQNVQVNGQLIHQSSFSNWRMETIDASIPSNLLNSDQATVSWQGTGDNSDEVSIGFVNIRYPAEPNAEGATQLHTWLEASANSQLLEIENFGSAESVTLYDLTNHLRLSTDYEEGVVRFVLPPSTEERELLIMGNEAEITSTPPTPVELLLPDLDHADYLILTHPDLQSGPQDQVQTYANYRESVAGGSHNTAIIDINELYEVFGYGIRYHPQAVRNFVHWALKTNPNATYLLIIGKGREYNAIRKPDQLQAALGATLFVPSFGYPASDNLFTASLDLPTPKLQVGRLSVVHPEEIAIYLDKVIALEDQVNNGQSIPEKAWMKNLLHLGGGGTPTEQLSIKNLLVNMENEIENNRFGGEVTALYRTSTDPIETSRIDAIFDRINEGVSIISFFGHSSSNGFDFNIDLPENYENGDRCPLMLSLGCYSGNLFEPFRSVGERFVLLEDGGAIAFAATRGVGFIHALGPFAERFYEHIGDEHYGNTIGKSIQETIRDYQYFTDNAYGTLAEQFSLHGDPAIRLNPSEGPDYTFDPLSPQFEPAVVSVQKDSFSFSVDVYNLGYHVEDSLSIKFEQQLPGGELISLPAIRIPTPPYRTTLELSFPTLGRSAVGLNTLFAQIDPDNNIPEAPPGAGEGNNDLQRAGGGQTGLPFNVVDNTAIPVWPAEYALVGDNNLTLKASTADAAAPERTYLVQLAEDPTFTNVLRSTEITQRGGVIQWTPQWNWQDSTVYYWRVSPDSTFTGSLGYLWEKSSFTYIEGISDGWGQGHWGQYQDNEFTNLQIDSLSKDLTYTDNILDIRIRNKVYDANDPPTYYNRDRFIGSPWTWSIQEGLNVVVLEYPALTYWRNPFGGLYGSVNTASNWSSVLPFAYPTVEQADRSNLMDFLTEIIPDSAYVIIYSAQRELSSNYRPDLWAADSLDLGGQNLFNVLENEGAQLIRQLQTTGAVPYLLFYQKGVGLIGETRAGSIEEEVQLNHAFEGFWYEGELTTTPIGPVKTWNNAELHLDLPPGDTPDSIRLNIQGLQTNGNWDTLQVYQGPAQILTSFDLSSVDPQNYPYLRFSYYSFDGDERSVPQPKHLHVYFQPLPELAINPAATFTFPDSLAQGQEVELIYGLENIGTVPVEDIQISYDFLNQAGNEFPDKPLPSWAPGEVLVDTLKFNTKDFSNGFELLVNLNPEDEPQEQVRFNNLLSLLRQTEQDRIDPILDVTFDSRRILEGDIVSPRPHIRIRLSDENRFLLLDDPSLVKLYLTPVGSGNPTFIDPSNYTWTSAVSGEENEAFIDYYPELSTGIYKLLIRGKDASDNDAGRTEYRINFEVIEEQTISNVLPYPNPFTTQTRFVYTITGAVPTDFYLQIMTVSGRVIREVDALEFGPLYIGTHLSDFVWDGTDEYGDPLANGVYLYRVVARDENGESIEVRDNGSSAYFVNGVGKVVLLR